MDLVPRPTSRQVQNARQALSLRVLNLFPKFAKYFFYLLLFVNLRSLPFAWHFQVFQPIIAIRLRYLGFRLRALFLSRQQWEKAEDKWMDNLCPVGEDPLSFHVPYYSWASFDDSDFNGHLSNSSYAKTCDAARSKALATRMFPMFYRTGGRIALAATYFNFIREIPALASYEVRVGLGGWDQKWLYVVCKFVTKPKKAKSSPNSKVNRTGRYSISFANINAAVEDGSSSSLGTPAGFATPSNTNAFTSVTNTGEAADAISHALNSRPHTNGKPREAKVFYEPDGAILHAVAISQGCFKVGRITVPPALALAVNGFSVPPAEQGDQYSLKNPPPTWWKAKKLMSKPYGGNLNRLREFFKGGWREAQDKWWEEALGGTIEERRKKGMELMTKLRSGMDSVR